MEIDALVFIEGGYSSLTNGNEGDVLANNQITSYANLVLQHLYALNGLPFNIQHEYATNFKLKLLFKIISIVFFVSNLLIRATLSLQKWNKSYIVTVVTKQITCKGTKRILLIEEVLTSSKKFKWRN